MIKEFFFDTEAIKYILEESLSPEELIIFDYITYVRIKLKQNSNIVNTSYGYQILKSKVRNIGDDTERARIWGMLEYYFKFNDFYSMEEIELDNRSIIDEEKEYITTLDKIYDMWYVVRDSSKFKDLSDKGIKILSLNDFNKIINADDDFKEWLSEEFPN